MGEIRGRLCTILHTGAKLYLNPKVNNLFCSLKINSSRIKICLKVKTHLLGLRLILIFTNYGM